MKARQRRLSLRFLAWYILKEDIQTDTHDSIEDALSALRLYKAFHEFEEQGLFDQKLEEIYKEGKQYVRCATFLAVLLLLNPVCYAEFQTASGSWRIGSCEWNSDTTVCDTT